MVIKKTIKLKDGLHSRPAMMISKLAREYNGDLRIISKNGSPLSINCSSIISIILGQCLYNDIIEFETNSEDVMNKLNELFDSELFQK